MRKLVGVARKSGLKLGDEVLDFGDEFDPAEYGNRRWTSMQKRGDIDLFYQEVDEEVDASVAPAESEEEGGDSSESPPSPFSSMNRRELLAHLDASEYSEDDIEGSGENGYVTVEDLRTFLDGLEEE